MSSLIKKYLSQSSDTLNVEIDASSLRDTFVVDWSDDVSEVVDTLLEEEPLAVLAVLEDERFRIFDPISDRNVLVPGTYLGSFQELLELTETIVTSFADRERSQ